MSSANAFADPEDSQLVADAKNDITEPVPFSYTEVTTSKFSLLLNLISFFSERCHFVQSRGWGYREGVEMDV